VRFTFGENWLSFSTVLDQARITDAERSLQRLLACHRLDGLSFLDIGAGSGLFTIAATRIGAQRAVAVDRDPNCLAAIRSNLDRFLPVDVVSRAEVRSGDILAQEKLAPGPFDVVYAWGSLHHTGAMWPAIKNAATYCADQGTFAMALYNRTKHSSRWLYIKQFYNKAPIPLQLVMVSLMAASRSLIRLLRMKHPWRIERGMSVWYDAIDWLGGVPYEVASVDEVTAFMKRLGFVPVRIFATAGSGCNEFVFRRER
jgi:predicted RNA methylase